MNEDIVERVAQLQHENSKLLDELNYLKEHTLYVEEALNLKCSELSKEKKLIKSLEQQIDSLSHMLKDKDQLTDSLENEKKKVKELHTKVSAENLQLKNDLLQEKLKNKQMEILKTKEEDFKNSYAKVKQENQKLISELSLKSDECLSNAACMKDLLLQVKELQNEKAELMALRDTLLMQEKEERLKSSENLECFFRKSPEWPKFRVGPFAVQGEHSTMTPFNRETPQVTLCQEILEVELQDKQEKIVQLESLLRKKEEDELERNKSILELKKELLHAGLLNCDSKIDLRLDSSAFHNIYNLLLKLIHWPEGQSGECKPLTDEGALSVVVKDGIQTTQPSSVRVIETISIASQTDPIRNLSPVLFRTFEKLQTNVDLNQTRSDSDDDGEESLPFDDGVKKGFQPFSEPKNCDLDMDMYRSCRKLSVLPEEDIDESFNRKSSLKKPYSSVLNGCHSKTQSADDITKMTPIRPSLKSVSSCSNLIPENGKLRDASDSFWEKRHSCDTKDGNTTLRNSKSDNKKNVIGLQPAVKSQKNAFRQPHSFDSYLDPLKCRSSPLSRQTSDPTQNTMVASPFARRESYIRRPKSTCRPLTLPCVRGDKKKEERICKVRFDLPGIVPKKDENVIEVNLNPMPVLNVTKKIKRVSRFSVEIIDEVEFRKSLEENAKTTRKRPPLIHSVVYKKSVFKDLTNIDGRNEANDLQEMNSFPVESPDSPVYDTAAEDSPVENLDAEYAENECFTDLYPLKRRRQSDVSCYSFEDSQSSSDGIDILLKSIKLHTNSECIVMKELKKRASDSSCSNPDSEIPYIDAEDLPVIKPSPDIVKTVPVREILSPEKQPLQMVVLTPGSVSESSDPYLTPCEGTPVLENNESSTFGPPKLSGLSKSPTVLKNLVNFELLAAISESRKSVQSEIIEEEKSEDKVSEGSDTEEKKASASDIIKESDTLKRTSSDVSEASESDTLTYGTVKSHMAASSDCDSDTYVTVWSDRSFALERKFSDLSENSSSPYNTPPDTSSASFCTPPDTYSPVLNSAKKYSENQREQHSDNLNGALDFLSSSPSFRHPRKLVIESSAFFSRPDAESLKPTEQKAIANSRVIFDSPKLEFYETNDSVENLEAFLQTEEGLMEGESSTSLKSEKPSEAENEPSFFETEELREALSKRNSFESPKLLERRSKKHPPLSRQNSTDEYNFLEPHDSCLNLSEEISSPSTTPDTSNKTVIFKNVPLTVSNTIDLEDDFPISETEIQVNFNSSQTEILEVPPKEGSVTRLAVDGHCLSEPCTPSISSADFLEFLVPRKQRSSFTEESLTCGKFEANLPEIIVSRLSSESDNSASDIPGCTETDFASNVSDRSEVHLSDVNSISGHSDNSGSLSEHSDNLMSDVFSSGSDKSTGTSPEITRNSSSSSSDKVLPSVENSAQEEHSPNCSVGSAGEAGVEIRGAGLEISQLESGEVSCVGDMPMFKRSNSSVSDQLDGSSLDLSENSSASDVDSDNSRDFNLNSKKFTDCNLRGTEQKIENINHSNSCDEYGINVRTEFDSLNTEEISEHEETQKEKDDFKMENTESPQEYENSSHLIETKRDSVPFTTSSTPKPGSIDCQALCNLFSISSDDSSPELDNKDATFLVLKTALKQNTCFALEEITKKFQDLSFAFKTDSMTIQKRLQLMKRRRDQAEYNIENELKVIKAKIKTLQYLGLNSEFLNLMSDLKKQLDFLLNAIVQLSSSAESYGYAQHEERFLELMAVMLQHVENMESFKSSESSKASDKIKDEREEKFLRRPSVAAITAEKNSRRRASIAVLPRVCFSSENGNNNQGLQWIPSRPAGNVVKKLSFSQASLKAQGNNFVDDSRRDSICIRHRRESRSNESSMKNIDEIPEPQSSPIESKIIEEPIVSLSSIEAKDSSLNLKQLFGSVEEIRRGSNNVQEQITPAYCIRRIIEWNKLLLNSTRFRWPENVLQYVPFYLTWYVVFVLAFVFVGGLFTGMNVCYTYSCLKYSALWFAAPAFFSFTRRFYRTLLPLFLALILLMVLFFLWFIKILLPRLTNEEVDSLFRTFGLEIRYLYGPPPI